MNLPNKISLFRIALIPLMVVVFYLPFEYNQLCAGMIFAFAASTDFLDGYIARKKNLVTDLGKFLDPIADKVLVMTALFLIVDGFGDLAPYTAIFSAIIISRELIIGGFRQIAATKGTVLAADRSGKAKTFLQDCAIIIILISRQLGNIAFLADSINSICLILLGAAMLLTLYSGASYIYFNNEVLKDKK